MAQPEGRELVIIEVVKLERTALKVMVKVKVAAAPIVALLASIEVVGPDKTGAGVVIELIAPEIVPFSFVATTLNQYSVDGDNEPAGLAETLIVVEPVTVDGVAVKVAVLDDKSEVVP